MRTLMIKVDEKKIEAMIKDGRSDVNYRNILLYVNNAHMDINEELSFDKLSSVNNITTIIYIFDLDTYIIDNPYDITYSAINNIAIITKEYSQYSCVVCDKSIYGLGNLYCILTRDFKMVYNAADSTIYLEGNKSSRYHFFQGIDRWIGKASMRIYSTTRYDAAKIKFVNSEPPAVTTIKTNTEPLYKHIALRTRTIEDHSYGLDLLKQILASDKFTAASLLTKVPVYRTGISIKDLSEIDAFIEAVKVGTPIDRKYDNKIKSYGCRLMAYGTFIVLKDAFVGLFVNSNSRVPFECIGQSRECMFIYMNHYCYYIGRSYYTSYVFTGTHVCIYENKDSKTSSKLYIDVADMSYRILGDFIRTCNKPLIPTDSTQGVCRQYLYKDIHPNMNILFK